MNHSRGHLTCLFLGLLILTGCSSETAQPAATTASPTPASTIFSAEVTQTASMNWVNMTGLSVEESIWQERLEDLCAGSIWKLANLERFAEQYLNEDQGNIGHLPNAMDALWASTVPACREQFSEETLGQSRPR